MPEWKGLAAVAGMVPCLSPHSFTHLPPFPLAQTLILSSQLQSSPVQSRDSLINLQFLSFSPLGTLIRANIEAFVDALIVFPFFFPATTLKAIFPFLHVLDCVIEEPNSISRRGNKSLSSLFQHARLNCDDHFPFPHGEFRINKRIRGQSTILCRFMASLHTEYVFLVTLLFI